MIEINRNSKELVSSFQNIISHEYIIVKEGQKIVFPKALVIKCGLKLGEYIHFLNEDNEWMFYSSDNTDGFILTNVNALSSNMQICSYPLSRLILKSTGFYKEKIFYVERTNIMHDKCPVFKLNSKTK